MFNFRKKDKEKEDKDKKKGKEKKDKKEQRRYNKPLGQDELDRLAEIGNSLNVSRPVVDKNSPGSSPTKERPTSLKLPSDSSDGSLSSHSLKTPENGVKNQTSAKTSPTKPNARPPLPSTKAPIIQSNLASKGIFKGRSSSMSKSSGTDSLAANTRANETMMDGPKMQKLNRSRVKTGMNKEPIESIAVEKHAIDLRMQGIGLGVNVGELSELGLPLPPLQPAKPPPSRTLTIPRLPAGDFGFSLRRAAIIDKQLAPDPADASKKTIIFAEPGSLGRSNSTGLLPGDRLLEVNDICVENKTRDEIIKLIKSSGDSVKLCVQLIPELVELTQRSSAVDGRQVQLDQNQISGGTLSRSGSKRFKKLAKSEDQIVNDKAWFEQERVWIIHKDGFSSGKKTKNNAKLAEGKLEVLVDNGQTIQVDEVDVESANPPHADRLDELSQMRYLNESSVLHVLRQRYASNLIHTYAGNTLMVINPLHPLPIYSEKVMQLFKGCRAEDMPPHIYAVAQTAYRKLLTSRKDQSIIFTGRSGSGKTCNLRHVLQYLAQVSGTVNKILTAERVNAVATLLDAFGNSRTVMNSNATRFTQLISVDYDQSGQISSASVQAYLFEKSRVARRPVKEPTFHVLYQMIAGIDDSLRKELHLENVADFNIFMSPLQRIEDKQKATLAWACIRNAMQVIGISSDEVKAIASILAAIYHLGSAGATIGSTNNSAQFSKPQNAQKAANLLGLSLEELSRTIFQTPASCLMPTSRSYRSPSPTVDNHISSDDDAIEALEAMVSGLYFELFNALISLINRCLTSGNRSVCSILLVDGPGTQNPATCGRTTGASFHELCNNYCQDRFHALFHEHAFTNQQLRYAQENVQCDFDELNSFISNPSTLVNMFDKQSAQSGLLTLTRSSTTDLSDMSSAASAGDSNGLLWLLDEQSLYPGANEQSFLDKINSMLSSDKQKNMWMRIDGKSLVVNHLQGTNAVRYNTNGWLKACRESAVSKAAAGLLQDSDHELISKLFVFARGSVSSVSNLMALDAGSSASLRRISSIRRGAGSGGLKRRSVPLQVKFQMDAILDTLKKTDMHFVKCVLAQHNSASSDSAKNSINASPILSSRINCDASQCPSVNLPLLRSQIRGFQVLPALRMHKQGYPHQMLFKEFVRRFAILVPSEELPPKSDEQQDEDKAAVEAMIDHLDIEHSSYRLGATKIFVRVGVLTQLEDQRDDKLKDLISRLQGYCKGYLGRKNINDMKVQQTAIKCIQRNVRKFNAIKNWSWWRLYVKLLPVLNVHKTEQDLRERNEQVDALKAKVDKMEKERNQFKHERDKLEAKMSELSADLVEEQATTVQAAQVLDVQSCERMRLEKELNQLKEKLSKNQKYTDQLEMEVMESRMFQANDINGHLSDADDNSDGSIYKQKYERSIKEFDFKMKRLKQMHEEQLEQELMHRKAVDKKLSQAVADTEEEHHHTMQWKKKCQKLNSEMHDLKIMLDTESSRNMMLEKKQRKFDCELNTIQEELKNEKASKDKISREKELLQSEKYCIEQELQSVKVDSELQAEKLTQLNRELDELAFGHKGEDEIFQLKKTKHELERKVQDQEEELDDLAGQVQMLEQAKLRLEMNMEKSKQEYKKEIAAREDEAEEARAVASKKVKAMEMQLECGHDDLQKMSREKHELERRILDLEDRPPEVDPEIERKLRRDLKRTKALLRDSQLMLDHNSENAANKSAIRQLRNQLEDAEFAKMAAVKSKQGLEMELEDMRVQLEETLKAKSEAVQKASSLGRDKAELQSQLEESEEEGAEVMKKYKSAVFQLSCEQTTLNEQSLMISDLEAERQSLKSLLADLSTKVEMLEGETTDIHTVRRLEMKIKELESKLELELTSKARLENQMSRVKEQNEKMEHDAMELRNKEQIALDNNKKLNRQIRDIREDFSDLQQKENEAHRKIHQLEVDLEASETEHSTTKADLKLAMRRIEDLQAAIETEMASDYSQYSPSNSESEDDESDVETFLSSHTSVGSCQPVSPGGRSRYDKVTTPSDDGEASWMQSSKVGDEPAQQQFV